MSAVTCGCGRATEAGHTVAHAPRCKPGDTCGPGCDSVCGRCAELIRESGWHDDSLGNLRAVKP